MKVDFVYDKKINIWFTIMFLMAAILCVTTHYPWQILVGFGILYYFFKCFKIELNEKLPWVWTGIMFIGGATLTMFSIQYLLLEWELFMKTSDQKLVLNIGCCLVVYLLVQLFTNNSSLTCGIAHIGLLLFGFVNYFVYLFRGNEFSFADLKSMATGLSVAGNYKFTLNERCAYVILASILFLAFVNMFEVHFQKPWQMRVIAVLLMAVCCVYVGFYSIDVKTETWEQKGSYRNGYLLNFVLQIRDSFVRPPEGYSVEAVAELEKQYKESDASRAEADVEKPTVIVIMNESFADLRILGNLQTNMELTPFLDSLEENTVKGYALSSVYGAKTPNSEWEFLSGNSMAFLPEGSVVYQQYISEEPTTLVSTLKNEGYTTVAMHPYYETGWSRNQVYPNMGYDEMYFLEYFDQNQLMRKYITDEELYNKIIKRFESRGRNENLYIMGITMQNHGGYGEEYDNFKPYVYKMGLSYADVNQYLQLVHESDLALEDFIQYFEQVDEPVEIVFFGDHHPGLNSRFYSDMNQKGLSGLTMEEMEKLYTVPFFIWTNYETEHKTVDITSLNYLSTMALERANIDLPAYNQFLAQMQEIVPAINSRGFYSKSRGTFLHLEEAAGEEEQWIQKYKILQYNNMFGKRKQSKLFFPYIDYGE